MKNEQLDNIINLYNAKQNSLDAEPVKEYHLAISKLKNEIWLIKDLL